jgi:hypothetical protein
MVAFVALYRGPTLSQAELVSVSIRRDLIEKAVDVMLDEQRKSEDPVADALGRGRSRALEIVREELDV